MKRTIFFSTLPVLLLIALTGCNHSSATTESGPRPQEGLRVVKMKLGSHTFDLEVADSEKTRETGLMYRDSMPDDHGMIFVFDDERERGFYMKNTRIPLDIAYVRTDGTVVSVKQMQPLDLQTTASDEPAKYAVEMNAGAAKDIGLKAGDRLELPAEAKEPRP